MPIAGLVLVGLDAASPANNKLHLRGMWLLNLFTWGNRPKDGFGAPYTTPVGYGTVWNSRNTFFIVIKDTDGDGIPDRLENR